jgi:hypothetical protein
MIAPDLCYSQVEYLSLRLGDPMARRVGILPIVIKKAKKSDIIKLQSSIVNTQFFDKSGFTFRYSQIARVGLKMLFSLKK